LDEESGEIPVAFVVRKNGSRLSPEAVMDYVSKQVFHFELCGSMHIFIALIQGWEIYTKSLFDASKYLLLNVIVAESFSPQHFLITSAYYLSAITTLESKHLGI